MRSLRGESEKLRVGIQRLYTSGGHKDQLQLVEQFCSLHLWMTQTVTQAYIRTDGSVDEERAGIKRAELFNLIEELVLWENSNKPRVINKARAEIARCIASRKVELGELQKETIIFGKQNGEVHPKGPVSGDGVTAWEVQLMQTSSEVVNSFLAEFGPPVLDPFCGAGSIPLEAQRLGLRACASDLNAVPILITKAMVEIPARFADAEPVNSKWQNNTPEQKAAHVWERGQGLGCDLRYYAKLVCDMVHDSVGHLYPSVCITESLAKDRSDLTKLVGQELNTVAYLWARTVASPNPAANGAFVPLVSTYKLRSKGNCQAWLEPIVDDSTNSYSFQVRVGTPSESERTLAKSGSKSGRGAQFTCLLTGSPMDAKYVREQIASGKSELTLLAVVAAVGQRGRVYLPASCLDVDTSWL